MSETHRDTNYKKEGGSEKEILQLAFNSFQQFEIRKFIFLNELFFF